MANIKKSLGLGLVAATLALLAGCATQGSGGEYGTNAACCPTPSCTTSCPAPCDLKGPAACKSACDTCNTCDTCDTCAPVCKTIKKRHRKVCRTCG